MLERKQKQHHLKWIHSFMNCVFIFSRGKDQRNFSLSLGVNRSLSLADTERSRHVKRYVDGQTGMQPIVSVPVPVKKIKGAACQCKGVIILAESETSLATSL